MCKTEIYEQELMLRFSNQTVKCYLSQFEKFKEYFSSKDIRYLSEHELKSYILFLHSIYHYSAIVHAISAIQFYYKIITKRKRVINLPKPRKPKTLPTVLSFNEVQKMIKSTLNLKHRAIIEIMFCHGLRRSELINLKISDIDSENMHLTVKNAKGLKDRNIPLNEDCLKILREYYKAFKPEEYLFNGQFSEQYTASSLRNIVINAAKRVGIKKDISPHTLRHSFASYLVSININLAKIQQWLGHSSSKTTEIYCHVMQEGNPIQLAS